MRIALTAVLWLLLGNVEVASAHAFGQRYDLPVPLELYLLGAAAAVAFSFVVIAAFVRRTPGPHAYPRINLLRYRFGRALAHGTILLTLKLISVGLLILVVLTGFLGDQHPIRNLAPTLVWIIWWVGLAYVSAFFGNLWALINPWRTLFAWVEALYRHMRPRHELSLRLPYPTRLGVWPAVVLLLAFSWIELISSEPAKPTNVAWFAIAYSLITWAGMFLFGRERWLKQGEAFSLLFGLLARFGPTEISLSRTAVCSTCGLGCRDQDGRCVDCYQCFELAESHDRQWFLRPFAAGLMRNEQISTSMMVFVLLVLSVVLFDGFLATPAWWTLQDLLLPYSSVPGDSYDIFVRTLALVAFWLVFLGAYLGTCVLMTAVSGARLTPMDMARSFALTLVPIAIAYHLAHYLTYLLIQGQYVVPLLSDPFGYGWNLFGTAEYRVNISVVGARFAWYTAVITIVVGHIVAVYLAHDRATYVLGEPRAAQRSQYPMTALMVAYTVTSLSILAEPIVESRPPDMIASDAAPTLVSIPQDAVVPVVGNGRLLPVGENKYAKARLTYKVMASAFHDGTKTTTADLLYSYVFAYRWSASGSNGSATYDPHIDESTSLIRAHLVALKATGVDVTSKSTRVGDFKFVREIHVVDVYLNTAAVDLQHVTAIAPPWSTLPWHVVALMEAAVSRGWAAFSKEQAASRQLPWLDLVRRDELNVQLLSLVKKFERQGYRPESLRELVSEDEARRRWSALKTFYGKYLHFLVTNG
ncbi:MAG: hypothetical protein ACE5LB_14635, partial [Acidiferrobacterales bacterium]